MNTHRSLNDADLPAPLPLRVVPSHDEDLLSLLRRTAARMGYPDYRWLLRPEGRGWDIKDTVLPLLSAKHDYQILEHLLLLSEEQVYSYTLHRFAAPLAQAHGQPLSAETQHNPSSLLWLSSKLQEAYFLPLHTIRVCPICLQEQEAYDRLFWRLHLILFCPYHRVRLLEKCPSCEAPIASNRQIASSCPRCQQAYGMVDPTPLSSTNPFSIGERLLLKALGFALQEDVPANRALATSPLSRLLDSSYLSFLHTLTSGLNARFSLQELVLLIKILGASSDEDLTQHQDLLKQQKVASFLLFHWLFLEWPRHFFTFLEMWYSLSTPPFMAQEPVPVLSSSHPLFHEPNKPDIEGWLQEAYQEFHRQFRPDPRRVDHLRETMNRLAQAADLPRKADEPWRRASSKQELRVYIPPRSLTPTPPLPWESLGSVLSHAARKMNHPYPELLLYDPPFSPGSSLFSPQSEVRLPPAAGDRMLAYLLQIPREHIAHLTGSSLVTALGLPPYNLSRFWMQLTDPDLRRWLHPFMTDTTRVCPYCIREQPGYDRLYWSMQGVQSCPRHNVRLLKKCPACLKPIPVARPLSNRCPFCQSELCVSTMESLPKDNVLTAGTSLLLTMLQIPSSEASDTFKFLSPLLTVTPDRYFGLLIALTEEVGSYYAYSQQRLLQLCHQLGEDTVSLEVAEDDPHAIDSDVLLFHVLFSHWPERFFAFLDIIYDTVHLPLRPPGYLSFRWHWLLTKRWWLITPRWLFDAFEEHERRYRESEDFLSRVQW